MFSSDYHAPEKRSIANGIKLIFKDGSESDLVIVEYPIGHQRRRKEGLPVLLDKFKHNLNTRFTAEKTEEILNAMNDANALAAMSVIDFMSMWVI